jgi:hypothetical protein
MAIRSLKTGQFSRSALVGNPVIMPGSYESIATYTVTSGTTSSITFSNIPSTYAHLQVRGFGQSTGTPQIRFRFNSDTGNNYAWHCLEGNGTNAGVQKTTTTNEMLIFVNGFIGANTPSPFVTDILDYANTNKYKTIRSINGGDNNSAGNIALNSGLWQNTSAVTSITIASTGTAFSQYSTFALYGVN